MSNQFKSNTSRRSVRAGIGAGVGAFAAGGVNLSLAAGTGDKRFVLVILRGGMDGLALAPPFGDESYTSLRGALAIPAPSEDNGALDLNGFHGLHPAASALLPFWLRQEMLLFPAAASPYRGRSHFDAQDTLENGSTSPNGAKTGWLNRALGYMSDDAASAVAVTKRMPFVLFGPNPATTWPSDQLPEPVTGFFEKVALLYSGDAVFAPLLAEGLRQRETLASRLSEEDRLSGKGAWRPQDLDVIAEMAAQSLRSENGARIAVLEAGGWDTHQNQGALQGPLARRFSGLAGALSAMAVELGPVWSDTVVAVVSEFGRAAVPNGTRGTDHGTAGAMLLLGGAVAGGRVAGDWPGLAKGELLHGTDLAPTIDTRAVFASILIDHLGLSLSGSQNTVFPNGGVAPISGLIR